MEEEKLIAILQAAIDAVAGPLMARLDTLEKIVNDVIIRSAIEAAREEGVCSAKTKWSESFEPVREAYALIEPTYDFYADVYDNELDDDAANAKLAEIKSKLEAIAAVAAPKEAAAIEEVIENIEQPAIEVSEEDIRSFRRGARVR